MWQIVKENLKTGKVEWCGAYSSLKEGLRYAPEILDSYLDELQVGIDEKDEIIGDFMQCGGRVAVVVGDWQFYLTKRMFDCYGNKTAEPSGSIRVGGWAKWKDPDGGAIYEVKVTEICSPELIRVETANGSYFESPFTELKAK